MKNTKFNRLLMVLMMSAAAASLSAGRVVSEEVTVVQESAPAATAFFPVGLESLYDIEEIDNGPQYIITEKESAKYRAEAAPVDFTVEAPSVLKVGENPNAPLMGQMDVAMAKLQDMKRVEDAADLSEVVYELEMANHEIQSLPILEGNKRAYDRQVIKSERRLKAAEHQYRKLTHGRHAKN